MSEALWCSCITCVAEHRIHNPSRWQSSSSRSRKDGVCLSGSLNFSSYTKGKVTRKLVTVHRLNKPVSSFGECANWIRSCQLVAPANRWCFGPVGKRINSSILSGFSSSLVCEVTETSTLVQTRDEEPYTSVDGHGVDGHESISNTDALCSNLERRECEFETKLHFLEERDEEIMSKRLLRLSRSNKVRSALELYTSMERSGLLPNIHACNSLLSCLLRNGPMNHAFRFFMVMMEKDIATGHTFSLFFKATAIAQGCDASLELFAELEGKAKLKASDVIVYNTMISVCAKANNWAQMERMWRKLKDDGHTGTVITYSLLVCNFVRCGQTELALDAFHEMINNQLKPGEDVMKAVLGACSMEGKWELSLSVFQQMLDSGLKPNAIAYNAVINCLGKAGKIDLAFRVYSLMKSSGLTADAYTLNALLGALNRESRFSDALQLFDQIGRENSSELNAHHYNMALLSCQKLALWDRALQILWKMEENGLSVSTVSYNHVISACEAARKPKVSLQVYKHMNHNKCTPDTFTYLSMIRACIWGSLWTEAIEILDRVTPNVSLSSLYNALVHGMCLRGQYIMAKKLYLRMRGIGLKPDGKTRALMLQHFRKN